MLLLGVSFFKYSAIFAVYKVHENWSAQVNVDLGNKRRS